MPLEKNDIILYKELNDGWLYADNNIDIKEKIIELITNLNKFHNTYNIDEKLKSDIDNIINKEENVGIINK
jgi:hypothetical protein